MKCEACGELMRSTRENYNYSASGLPYVTLVHVEVRRCKACGEHEVVIPRIAQLHRAIALSVVNKRPRLTGAEVRFLRKYLGWSGADFAKHMGVAAESVSRWENERDKMAATADRLLRLMVATRRPVSDYDLDFLAELEDEAAPIHLRLESAKEGWLAERIAA